ncbi:MAG: ABC transporter permease, partial [Acidobacteria bacterium]|nr:ABC transporter permease [Acidobacteriota bacterium]
MKRLLSNLPSAICNPQSIAAGLCLLWFVAALPFTPGLASSANLANLFSNLLPLLIVAAGQTLVLITGGIDLSATSVMALASVSGTLLMQGRG